MRILISIYIAFLALILVGCSVTDVPERLEPVVRLLDAEDVGRDCALLRAEVERRGADGIASLRFGYAPEGGEESLTESVTVVTDRATCRLTGLTPGTTYRCRAIGVAGMGSTARSTDKGNTAGAVEIVSDWVTFITVAAEVPTLGECRIVTQGPTTMLVELVVVDDGGYPIADVGCHLEDLTSAQPLRESAPSGHGSEANVGDSGRSLKASSPLMADAYTILVEKLTPGHLYRLTPYATNSVGTAYGEPFEYTAGEAYIVQQPGQLAELIAGATLPDGRLVVAGPLNGDDFRVIRSLFGADTRASSTKSSVAPLSSLDLSGVQIVAGGGSYDGSRKTVDNTVTTGLLASLPMLESVRLPMGAVAIERDALAHCPALRSLTVPASVREVLPSEGCVSLEEISVEDGNVEFTSVEGVLFDAGIERLVWFPCGKEGAYQMPATVVAIGRDAFRGTRITSLTLPDGLTQIERGAFSGSALEEIRMPEGLTNVAEGLFQGCAALRSVALGAATEWLGAYVFDGVPLERLEVAAEWPPVVVADTFVSATASGDVRSSCVLVVPASSLPLYRAHPQWGKFESVSH